MPLMPSTSSMTPSSLMARCRYELARHRWVYRAVVVGLLVAAVWATATLNAGVAAERARWGETIAVVVATTEIGPGDALHGRVTEREHPVAVVPADAIHSVDDDTTARRRIPAGGVVTGLDVSAAGGPQALLGPDQLAVAVTERVPSGAVMGDTVVVTTEGIVLADDATVVAVHDDRVTVAVDAAVAPMVAAAVEGPSGVSLLLTP